MHPRPNSNPARISVVIPLFNQAEFVGEAVDSVLEQGYPNLEIIIIDDGSTDASHAVVKDLAGPIAVHTQNNRGPAAARNQGLARASGELIAFLDADDRWPRNKLVNQLPPLLEDPGVEITLGRIRRLESSPDASAGGRFSLSEAGFYGVQLGSGVFRRTVFARVGDFDESCRQSEDHDWFFRAREHGVEIVAVEADGLHYRVHEGGITRRETSDRGYGLPRVLKRSLERRRERHDGRAPSLGLFSEIRTWKPLV